MIEAADRDADWPAWLVLILLPFLAHAIDLAGFLSADPMQFASGLITDYPEGVLRGLPGWHDPNVGFTTQALGGLAAHQWLQGVLPWWNPYGGVGLPLAAEMQNSAFFLPFVLLLGQPDGPVLVKISQQIIAGLATFALLRQIGIGRTIALLGATLFALNGTFAWAGDAPIMPVAFLPVLALGVERAFDRACRGRRGGGGFITVAIAWSIYAGFPEVAYIDGLLVLAWASYRLVTAPAAARIRFAATVLTGGIAGLLIAAPIILPFFALLPNAYTGIHDSMGHAALRAGNFAMILIPYVIGPVYFAYQWEVWGYAGGYLALPLVILAVLSLRRGGRAFGLRVVLAIWILGALAKSAAVPGITALYNLVPLIALSAFYRYAFPSWEFAAVILVTFALDDWQRGYGPGRRRLMVTVALCGVATLAALWAAGPVMSVVRQAEPAYPIYLATALAWVALVAAMVVLLVSGGPSSVRLRILCAVLAIDGVANFSLPLLAGAPRDNVDLSDLQFLRLGLGLQRVFTLGPLAPNYGAFFGVAEINHNYLPVPRIWVDYVRAHLDPAADDVSFTGRYPVDTPGEETRAETLVRRLAAYQETGVRYVLAKPGVDPFAGTTPHPPLVHRSAVMDIFELPNPAPYFSAGDACRLVPAGRATLDADCTAPETLVRRELFFPGWQVSIDGAPGAIMQVHEIFQGVALPAGRSKIVFTYAPPRIGWAYAAFWLGFSMFLAGVALSRRPVVSRGTLGGMT